MTSRSSRRSLRLSVISFLRNHYAAALLIFSLAMLTPGALAVTGTNTALTISSTSVPYKTPIILTATVTTTGDTPVRAGFVLFCDATATHCENNSALRRVQLTAATATAVVKIGSGPLGIHQYKAVYYANDLYSSSTSNTVSYTVQGTYPSTTTALSSGRVGNYTLIANVTAMGALLAAPSGDISFLDTSAGNKIIGTRALGTAVVNQSFSQAPGSPFSIASAPSSGTPSTRSVAIASDYIDNDNNLDLVTANTDQTVTVLLGNGDGSFKPKVNYTGCLTGDPVKILLADFNRDGSIDIALGCSNGVQGGLAILLGNDDGTFQSPVTYSSGAVEGLAMGDFNNDGILDMVVTDQAQGNVTIFLGNGDGTFQAGTIALYPPQQPNDVVVADFDGDGKADLAYAMTATTGNLSDLYFAKGNGDGTFKSAVLVASNIGEFLTTGDTNGDNIPDIVSTTVQNSSPNTIGNSLFVLLGIGDGTFQSPVTYVSDIPSDPHLADVNGDGKPDIIAGGSYGALVYLGNGNGTFQAYSEPVMGGSNPQNSFQRTYAVNAGDYNNDGNADLVGTDADNYQAAVSLSEVQQVADANALTDLALLPLGSGTHYIDASYPGDHIFLSSISSTIPLQAAPTPTTLNLVVSPTTAITAGQSLTLQATLDPYTVGLPTTTTDGGSVKFFSGATYLGNGTLTSGVATLTTTAVPSGNDALQAAYPGDTNGNYEESSSNIVNVTVASILLTSSPNPSIYGQTVTLVATVPSGEQGTVTFMDGGTTLGNVTISNATASFPISTLTVGHHNITAISSGDSNHPAATSPVVIQVVTVVATPLTITTAGTDIYGSPLTITATLSAGPTGSVVFTSGTTALGSGTINTSGIATISTSVLPVGTDPITASYAGDGNYNPASASITQVISQITPLVTLVSSLNPATVNQTITFTASIPSAATGTITFYDGSTALATVPVSGGTASTATSTLSPGAHTILATYNGDANNNSASSTPLSQTINKQTPVLPAPSVSSTTPTVGSQETISETVPPGVTGPVTFYNGSTPIGTAPIVNGVATITITTLPIGTDPITATTPPDANNNAATSPATIVTIAKFTPTLPPPAVSTTTPTPNTPVTITEQVPTGAAGPVTFNDGGTVLGTAPIIGGIATITVPSLPLGPNPITATVPASDTSNSATSPVTQVVVAKITTTVTLSSSANPAQFNQPVTFTATVPAAASGSITFSDGSVVLGTVAVNNAGIAVLTTSNLTIGSHTITASYSGNTSYETAISTPLAQTIGKIPTATTLSQSALTQLLNNSVTFAATVTAPSPTPTGTVTFLEGTTVLGISALNTNGTVVALAKSANAAYATSTLSTGSHQIVAVYSGDANFASSTSAPVTYIVQDFTNTVSGTSSQNLFPGDKTSYTFDLAPLGATTFLSDLSLTVTGLPPGTTYTLTPATIAAGSNKTSVVLNVVTSSSLTAQNHLPGNDSKSHRGLPIAMSILGLFGLGIVRKHGRKMPRTLMLLLLLLGSLLPITGLSGCAGGYFTLTPTTYSVNVTGVEGSIQHTATATLVVQ